ncbi:MAG: hypothetical protein ABJI43_17220 [Roseobacter sp.]
MADRVEITDRESAAAWLQTQDHQTQVWFASRCTLRALPALGHYKDATKSGLAFATLRATIISAGAGTMPPAEMKGLASAAHSAAARSAPFSAADSAARSAADSAADSAAFSADSAAARSAAFSAFSAAARSAAFSADSAASAAAFAAAFAAARSAAFSAFSAADSAASLDAQYPLDWSPLWHAQDMPRRLQQGWRALKKQWDEDEADWSFWVEWYDAILIGTPLPWELTHCIALEVTDEEWDAGPATVAQKIAAIRLNWRTEITSRLQFDKADGVFKPEPSETIPPDIESFVVARVRNALSSALKDGGANGFTEESFEAVHLERVLSDEHPDASLFATTCWDACMSLNRSIGDLYPEDASLIVLKNTLYTGIGEICENNDVIRTRIANLAALETRAYPTDAEKTELEKLPDVLEAELNDEARETYASDVEIILSNPKPPRAVRARVTNWTTTILSWMDKTRTGDKRLAWLTGVANRISNWWQD